MREQLSFDILNTILQDNSTRPVRLQQLTVKGFDAFRPSFLNRQLDPLLNNDQLTMEKLMTNIDQATENLTKQGAIRDIKVNIKETNHRSPFSPLNGVDLSAEMFVLPVKSFFAKIGTNVGNGEGDGYLTLQLRNIFGGAENLILDTNIASNNIGSKSRSTHLLNYSMPLNNSPNWRIDNLCYHMARSIDYTAAHDQTASGFTSRISSTYGTLNHEISFENLVRSIEMQTQSSRIQPNDFMLAQSGRDYKSSLTYNVAYDTRDDKLLPRTGVLVKNILELSGFTPVSLLFPEAFSKSSFVKNTFQFQTAKSLNNRGSYFASFSFNAGALYSFAPTTHLMDRFFMGGPNDVRGFTLNGMGPKQSAYSVGGNVFYNIGVSCFCPLPRSPSDSNFRLHGFLNAGNLANIDKSAFRDPITIGNFMAQPSISTGFGLVYKHPVARFELNFVVPVIQHASDQTRKGIQYGIGLSFM